MEELRFNSIGTDAVYLANVNIFFTALFDLPFFQNEWREDKLGSRSVLQTAVDWFRQKYEGGLTGNRLDIAARNAARKDLNVTIQKILHYVMIFAEERDIAVLVNSGVVRRKTGKRARRTPKVVVAN